MAPGPQRTLFAFCGKMSGDSNQPGGLELANSAQAGSADRSQEDDPYDQLHLRLVLREQVGAHLHTLCERLVWLAYFEQGMRPRAIAQRYPGRFSSARAVSVIVQRLLRRLQSDRVLRELACSSSVIERPRSPAPVATLA
jgi:hypothetical protein